MFDKILDVLGIALLVFVGCMLVIGAAQWLLAVVQEPLAWLLAMTAIIAYMMGGNRS